MATKRVSKQHQGGLANFAGSEFERFFGVYRVLLALQRLRSGESSSLAMQLKHCHVDDWVEDRPSSRDHFQLKRTKNLSWNSVRADFRKQLKKKFNGKTCSVALVVSDRKLAKRLRSSPRAVPRASVLHFPGYTSVKGQLSSTLVRNTLWASCVLPAPTASDLEWIWKDVSHAWSKARKPGKFVSARKVIEHVDDQNPPPLRRAWRATPKWRVARSLLARVTAFSFEVKDGHLHYDDGAGTEGWVSCRTAAFREFVSGVVHNGAMSVSTVRKLLECL